MRILFLSLSGVLLAGSGCVYYERVPEYAVRPAVSQDEVRKMVQAAIGDDVIIAKIKSDGITAKPSVDEILKLKEDGVSEGVIEAILSARVVTPVRRTLPERIYRYYPSTSLYYGPWYYGWGHHSYGHHSYGRHGGRHGGHH